MRSVSLAEFTAVTSVLIPICWSHPRRTGRRRPRSAPNCARSTGSRAAGQVHRALGHLADAVAVRIDVSGVLEELVRPRDIPADLVCARRFPIARLQGHGRDEDVTRHPVAEHDLLVELVAVDRHADRSSHDRVGQRRVSVSVRGEAVAGLLVRGSEFNAISENEGIGPTIVSMLSAFFSVLKTLGVVT
jgi:hypothetical protein